MTTAVAPFPSAFADAWEQADTATAPGVVVGDRFGPWIARARPEHRWDAPHFRVMQAALDDATALVSRRIVFDVPIRHGKTEHNTVGYAAYRLARDPKTRVLVCSYNQPQANKLSREIKKLARKQGVQISPERDAAGEWETTAGGGVRAVGAGSGVASVNADVILIDDPIGKRDDAESVATREQVWDWLTNDVLARAEPHTVVILSMSRWHMDDPVGRLLERHGGRWRHVRLPAEAEEADPMGRPVGAPLWPALRGVEWLAEKRVELGAYGFSSLLQLRPRPREGGMFKWDWFQIVEAAPVHATRTRYWDLAGTEVRRAARGVAANDPDFTSGTLMARTPRGRYCVEDVARGQWSLAKRDAMIVETARADAAKYGAGAVVIWLEADQGVGGAERTNAIVRALAGHVVHVERPVTNKVLRAEPYASQAEASNVDMLRAVWNTAVLSVYTSFPTGTHDDDVDSAAGAFNKLAAGAGQGWLSVPVAR